MAEETNDKTQKTQPKKGDPVEIPVPSEDQIERDFLKVALAAQEPDEDEVRSTD